MPHGDMVWHCPLDAALGSTVRHRPVQAREGLANREAWFFLTGESLLNHLFCQGRLAREANHPLTDLRNAKLRGVQPEHHDVIPRCCENPAESPKSLPVERPHQRRNILHYGRIRFQGDNSPRDGHQHAVAGVSFCPWPRDRKALTGRPRNYERSLLTSRRLQYGITGRDGCAPRNTSWNSSRTLEVVAKRLQRSFRDIHAGNNVASEFARGV
jgi:hypothetical protein